MEGKIFNESANIYQDQAKVLYEYYKSAAEKIVNEEKNLEEKIANDQYQIGKYEEDRKKRKTWMTVCIVGCVLFVALAAGLAFYLKAVEAPVFIVGGLAVGLLILALMQNSRAKEFEALIAEKQKAVAGYRKAHKEIFRDYKVTKMGVAYVPVAKRVAYNDKSFIVDQSGVTRKEKFTLQVIRQNDLIGEAVADLQALTKNAPIVESSKEPETVNTNEMSRSIQKVNFNDYFGKLDRTLRTISYSLGNVEEYNVELPIVFPDTDYARFLKNHMATDVKGSPVFKVFDSSRYDDDIQRFNDINDTRKALSNRSEQIDMVLKNLMVDMADTVQSTVTRRIASASSLVEYTNKILFNILKAPYNFYSPVLEAEEIERIRHESFDYESIDYHYQPFSLRDSSKVRLDLNSMSWVADDGSRTTVPFGINQIQYEVIAPIVSNLLKDTKKERVEIYNHIKDQKLSYLNKWHQDTEDFYGRNRAEAADIINLMRSTLADYSAAYNTLAAYKKTEESMSATQSLEAAVTETTDNSAEVLAGYQAQAQQVGQVQQEFSEYMDRLHEDIDARAEKFGYVEYFDASLRDRRAKDIAVAADNVNALDERRRPLAEVNPLLASESELPPAPSIDDVAYRYAGINLNAVALEALENIRKAEAAPAVHEVAEDVEDEPVSEYEDVVDNEFVEEVEVEEVEDEVDDEESDEIEDEVVEDEEEVADDEEIAGDEEEDDDEEEIMIEDVDEILSDLLEDDPEDKYGVKALAEKFAEMKGTMDTESEEFYDKMLDIYEAALDIEDNMSNDSK